MNIDQAIEIMQNLRKTYGNIEVCLIDCEDEFFTFTFPVGAAPFGVPNEDGTGEILVCGLVSYDFVKATGIDGQMKQPDLKLVKAEQ